MMRKRSFIIVLNALLLISLLSGCRKEEQSGETDVLPLPAVEQSAPAAPETPIAVGEPAELPEEPVADNGTGESTQGAPAQESVAHPPEAKALQEQWQEIVQQFGAEGIELPQQPLT